MPCLRGVRSSQSERREQPSALVGDAKVPERGRFQRTRRALPADEVPDSVARSRPFRVVAKSGADDDALH